MFNPFQKAQDARRKKAAAPNKKESAPEKPSSASQSSGEQLGKNEKFLLHNFNGVLKSGEMALVVGRPGSGCTTFLKSASSALPLACCHDLSPTELDRIRVRAPHLPQPLT